MKSAVCARSLGAFLVWLNALIVIEAASIVNKTSNAAWTPKQNNHSDASLFQVPPLIHVSGPTTFPSPTRKLDIRYNQTISIVSQPTYGNHRADADAILAYAEGYQLSSYMMFIETLTETGYTGDVVLAVAHDSYIQQGVKEYLLQFTSNGSNVTHEDDLNRTRQGPNLVIYQLDLDCDGTPDGKRLVLKRSQTTDSFQMCRLDHVYGYHDAISNTIIPLPDSRKGRVVATLRYEWYWIWSRQYHSHSWMMLVDARDTYFQTNPFANLPRSTATNADNKKQGLLYFFGENANATRLGKSIYNANWLRNGYGDALLAAIADKPTICSGSTMGEQVAIETYLRALINEHDEGTVRMTGSDQGFHNYLYYSGKLKNAQAISKLVVWEQGHGIINNLGALRTDSFTNWGIHDPKTNVIYQWDGQTPSPVVHQWDRDKALHGYMMQRQREWNKQWMARMKAK
jgi:hypothetical protein